MTLSTRQTRYLGREKTFAVEASEAGISPADHMPGTIDLESHVTGNVWEFTYLRTEKDGDGDVRAFVYRHPRTKYLLRIYND